MTVNLKPLIERPVTQATRRRSLSCARSDRFWQTTSSAGFAEQHDLRATGALAWPRDKIGGAPDHNTAQWGLWIGRPLLGQWALDVRRLLEFVAPERLHVTPSCGLGTVPRDAAETKLVRLARAARAAV